MTINTRLVFSSQFQPEYSFKCVQKQFSCANSAEKKNGLKLFVGICFWVDSFNTKNIEFDCLNVNFELSYAKLFVLELNDWRPDS